MSDEKIAANLPYPPQIPVLEREKFALLVGVSAGVVQGWIDKGYLPVYEIGRYRLVNVALLTRQALDKDFSL